MSSTPDAKHAITFFDTVPILRIFSVEKAKEFYCGFLGFKIDWEHTFEPGMPVYMQVSRGHLRLHLSEHHGDGSPGTHIFVEMTGVDAFHSEVTSRAYKYMRPGIEETFYGARAMKVIDPFGNRIIFNEFEEGRE
jgi:catechol 2,3-dioxygenase-like lactoylglutathione lyase family enzyme